MGPRSGSFSQHPVSHVEQIVEPRARRLLLDLALEAGERGDLARDHPGLGNDQTIGALALPSRSVSRVRLNFVATVEVDRELSNIIVISMPIGMDGWRVHDVGFDCDREVAAKAILETQVDGHSAAKDSSGSEDLVARNTLVGDDQMRLIGHAGIGREE